MNSLLSWRGQLLLLVLGGAAVAATGCSKSADTDLSTALMHNDFESMNGWLGQTPQPSLTREKAHSGHYSIKVDGNTEYSLGYNSTLGQLSNVRITKIKVEAWVLAPNAEAGGLLVTHIGDAVPNTKPMLWDGFDVVKAGQKYGDWVHVSKELEMPAAATASTNIGIFLWRNKGAQPVYLDDLVVTEVH